MAVTPETIWLADYFIENASLDDYTHTYKLYLPENFLYIDGVEITYLATYVDGFPKYIDYWYPFYDHFSSLHYPYIFLTNGMGYVKGDVWIEYDD